MTEKQFQQEIVNLARLYGWLCYHTYDSRRCEPGFPDLVLCKSVVIFAELKVGKNKLTPTQKVWIDTLKRAGARVYVWYPEDLERIQVILRDY